GPHGLTVRIAPHVLRHNASIATRLTSGDEWQSRPPYRGGLTSLNHNFCLSERDIFSRGALDSSGKTGGGFWPARSVAATLRWNTGGGTVRFGAGSGLANRVRRSPLWT